MYVKKQLSIMIIGVISYQFYFMLNALAHQFILEIVERNHIARGEDCTAIPSMQTGLFVHFKQNT